MVVTFHAVTRLGAARHGYAASAVRSRARQRDLAERGFVVRTGHARFSGPGRRERNVVGELQRWIAGLVVLAPPLAYVLTLRWCLALRRAGAHPLRAVDAELVSLPTTADDPALAPGAERG